MTIVYTDGGESIEYTEEFVREMVQSSKWRFLDLLERAASLGVNRVNRMEILNSTYLPYTHRVWLVSAADEMTPEFVTLHGEHDFEITEAGMEAIKAMYGENSPPSTAADRILMLPGAPRTKSVSELVAELRERRGW